MKHTENLEERLKQLAYLVYEARSVHEERATRMYHSTWTNILYRAKNGAVRPYFQLKPGEPLDKALWLEGLGICMRRAASLDPDCLRDLDGNLAQRVLKRVTDRISAWNFVRKARAFHFAGKYEEACDRYMKAIEIFRSPALFEEYARMLDKEGDAEAAREARKIAQYSELR